jgi:uncharacterized protein
MYISEINIYPIKSLKGISLDSAVVEERGLRHDRRWMLTDRAGKFLTQREFPRMALIETAVTNDGLVVTEEGAGSLTIPFMPDTGNVKDVVIWANICPGEIYENGVNEWFSHVLGTDCQLVYMPDDTRRGVNPRFDQNDNVVSFADGYPLMMLGESSLVDLNSRLDQPLPMNRFRPNLVVSGSEAFAEDRWQRVKIGNCEFRSTKPCERCVITTIDQSRGEFAGKEPLKTLASFRSAKHVMPDRIERLGVGPTAVLFGQNLIPEQTGANISVGDAVDVIL